MSATATTERPDPLAALNADQRRAVEHGIGGDARHRGPPLLIVAGAGSGKTNTLAHRVAHLVQHGVDPQRILLMTFSRRAASEMGNRVGRILAQVLGLPAQQRPPQLEWSGTFHSIAARLLREYAERIGLHPAFTIHDRADSADLLGMVRHTLGFSGTTNRFPTKATCLAIYSRVINSEAPVATVLSRTFPWCAAWEAELSRLFEAYVVEKQSQQVLDYDDLLLYWSHLAADPKIGAEIGARFDHVLVDEYQDTNRLQASILAGLKPDGCGLTVVGDDAQSIYAFRAATVRNILDFPKRFALPAEVITLEQNYRSTRQILEVSNAVIRLARERFAKTLWTDRAGSEKPRLTSVRDEADQARCVAERILEYREGGMALKSQAVLFRASSHSAALELELARRNIPFVKFGGLKFLEAAHVKDALSVLRWAENPRSRMAGFRVVQLLPGIGPVTAGKLVDAMDAASDPWLALEAFEPPPVAGEDWQQLIALFGALRDGQPAWPGEMDAVVAWYGTHLQRIFDDAAVRQGDLDQLARIAATYGSRERFLTELTLDPPNATSDEPGAPHRDDDYLILSTIHSAKGQEWKSVHILNLVDGCIPVDLATGSDEDIEEERRLLYVAMTRAREHLHLMVPQRFYVHQQTPSGDRHVYASRTRFIPETVARLCERDSWPQITPSEAARAALSAGMRIDLAARVRQRFA